MNTILMRLFEVKIILYYRLFQTKPHRNQTGHGVGGTDFGFGRGYGRGYGVEGDGVGGGIGFGTIDGNGRGVL